MIGKWESAKDFTENGISVRIFSKTLPVPFRDQVAEKRIERERSQAERGKTAPRGLKTLSREDARRKKEATS
jgi:hypothetical protein